MRLRLAVLLSFLCASSDLIFKCWSFIQVSNGFHLQQNSVSFGISYHCLTDRRSAQRAPRQRSLCVKAKQGIKRAGRGTKSGQVQGKVRPNHQKQLKRDDRSLNSAKRKVILKNAPSKVSQRSIFGDNIISCRSFNLDGQRSFSFIGSFNAISQIPFFSYPEIAFIGRSNVGKSSLLNCLTNQNKKIAVESKTPGRTQSINMFNCKDTIGDLCIFVDLPGYGFAKISKQRQQEISTFMHQYLTRRGALKMVFLLVDARRETQAADVEVSRFLEEEGIPYMVIATKIDKVSQDEMQKRMETFVGDFGLQEAGLIPFSAITGQGRRDVWRGIKEGILAGDEEFDEYSDEPYETGEIEDNENPL